MSDTKRTENGVRLCDEQTCELPATHTMVWTEKWQCYCLIHANKILGIANALSFATPKLTVRVMTIEEMVSDE